MEEDILMVVRGRFFFDDSVDTRTDIFGAKPQPDCLSQAQIRKLISLRPHSHACILMSCQCVNVHLDCCI